MNDQKASRRSDRDCSRVGAGVKAKFETIPKGKVVQSEFSYAPYMDHMSIKNITGFKTTEQVREHMERVGFPHHMALSDHPLAAGKNQRKTVLS